MNLYSLYFNCLLSTFGKSIRQLPWASSTPLYFTLIILQQDNTMNKELNKIILS